MALVLALAVMAVLALTAATLVDYSTSGARSSGLSKDGETAYHLAEAGINNALAVLNLPANNASSRAS